MVFDAINHVATLKAAVRLTAAAGRATGDLVGEVIDGSVKTFGHVLSSVSEPSNSLDPSNPGLVEASISSQLAELRDDVHQELRRLIGSLGMIDDSPVTLLIGPDASVQLVGHHPHRSMIEAKLADDRVLGESVTALLSFAADHHLSIEHLTFVIHPQSRGQSVWP